MKQQQRYYAAVASKSDIESRVLAVCKAFDRITADKVTSFSHNICSSILNSLLSKTQVLIAAYLWCREIPKKSFLTINTLFILDLMRGSQNYVCKWADQDWA